MSDERTLPHSLDAERSVLGAILVHNDAYHLVVPLITPQDFFRASHGRIFDKMMLLAGRAQPIDFVTVKEELAIAGQLDDCGGPAYISSLADGIPRATNIEHYARIVREKSMLRALIFAANRIVASAYAAEDAASEVLGEAEQAFLGLGQHVASGDLVPADVMAREVYPVLERLLQERRPVTGISTGFPTLDRLTRGFQPGDLVIIAGRPSQGKTSIALQFALHVAQTQQVGFFSLEMSRQAIELRAIASLARVDAHRLQCGQLSDGEQGRVGAAVQTLGELHWSVDDTPAITAVQIRSKARRMKAQRGLGMLVVDYLGLMGTGGRSENRTQEVSAISRAMKAVARDLDVPTLLLSQLSRKSEDRQEKRPQLSDLRDSGAIEQDADLVCMVHRPSAPDGYSDTLTELIIAKQRNGPIGTVELQFAKEQMRFAEVERRYE